MKLTKEQQEKFDQASSQIFDYYDQAYGRIALVNVATHLATKRFEELSQ